MYTIHQAAKLVGLSPYSLRYYEKEGLISHISRDSRGVRAYSEEDIKNIQLIVCLRGTGMSIAQIHDYLALCQEGDATLSVRREIIKRQEEVTLRQIDALQQQLETIKKRSLITTPFLRRITKAHKLFLCRNCFCLFFFQNKGKNHSALLSSMGASLQHRTSCILPRIFRQSMANVHFAETRGALLKNKIMRLMEVSADAMPGNLLAGLIHLLVYRRQIL